MARGKSVLTSMRFGCTALVALAAAKDWDPSAMVSEEGCGESYRRTLREREGIHPPNVDVQIGSDAVQSPKRRQKCDESSSF